MVHPLPSRFMVKDNAVTKEATVAISDLTPVFVAKVGQPLRVNEICGLAEPFAELAVSHIQQRILEVVVKGLLRATSQITITRIDFPGAVLH